MAILAYDDVMLRGKSPFELLMDDWRRRGASFLWGGYPNDPASWMVDRITGKVGVLKGGASIAKYGLTADGVNDAIYWPSNFGWSGEGMAFVAVEVKATTDSGAYFHIGSASSGGLSLGAFSGSNIIGLIDGIAFIDGGTKEQLSPGIRLYSIGHVDGITWIPYGTDQYVGGARSISNELLLQGYTSGDPVDRYAKNKVIAAAIFTNATSLTDQGNLKDAMRASPVWKALEGRPALAETLYF